MADPISAVSGALAIGQGAYRIGEFFQGVLRPNVIGALFRWDGQHVEGDDRIAVHQHSDPDRDDVWWFEVQAVDGFEFVRFPVISSCAQELVGRRDKESNADARVWRWIPPVPPGVIIGGGSEPANLKVDFVIVGYSPKALIGNLGEHGC